MNVDIPQRGQPVWLVVNGKPERRFFVEFHGHGVRLAFKTDLSGIVYYDYYGPGTFRPRKADLLLDMIAGMKTSISVKQAELGELERELRSCSGTADTVAP
jgi:hypothetical protein